MTEEKKSEKQKQIVLPKPENLLVSASPHLYGGETIPKIMLIVIIALLPACATGIYFFGINALRVLLLCTISCMGMEFILGRLAGRPDAWKDGSAAVTGILLGMNLSAGVPWWICLIGALLAIGLGKQIYGGLGYNPFNPALVARVGLLIGFPKIMTTWIAPTPGKFIAETVTCATPLGIEIDKFKLTGEKIADYLIGNRSGCLGETSVFALLLGGLALIILKIIRWQVPVAFIGTVLVFTGIVHYMSPSTTPTPIFHIATGGLFLGAFFMATDMVTSPMTGKGAFVFGTGCGIITCLIRIWGNYPEGVSFSILMMNALTPLIDRYTEKLPFGRAPERRRC